MTRDEYVLKHLNYADVCNCHTRECDLCLKVIELDELLNDATHEVVAELAQITRILADKFWEQGKKAESTCAHTIAQILEEASRDNTKGSHEDLPGTTPV